MSLQEPASSYRAVANGPSGISVMERRAVLSIRPRMLSGSTGAPMLFDVRYSLLVSGARVYYEILYGHVLQGDPVWRQMSADLEYDTDGTWVAGGIRVANGYAEGGRGSESGSATGFLERLGFDETSGASTRLLSIVCRSISQRSAICYGSLEVRVR